MIGYRAKENSELIDLGKTDHYAVRAFWEEVLSEGSKHGARIVLHPEKFYLLLSEDSVAIPPEYAAEMTAYDPTSGELRTHYAGFFDPGFGYDPAMRRSPGSRAALEVRAHDVPFMVEHGQRVCKLTLRAHARAAGPAVRPGHRTRTTSGRRSAEQALQAGAPPRALAAQPVQLTTAMDTPPASAALPERARVVVIGGGIIGTSVAYHLAHLGSARWCCWSATG